MMNGEIGISSIEIVEINFLDVIKPAIEAYEEFLYHEYGKDVQFNHVFHD